MVGQAPMFPCRTLSDPVRGQGRGFRLGPIRSQEGTSGSRMGTSVVPGYTGQWSDPSGLVGSRRAISSSDGFPSEPCFGTTGPDGCREIARLSHCGARLMYGPIRDPRASPWASGGSSGPERPPADPQRHHRTPLNRRLPGLGGPTLLVASTSAVVPGSSVGSSFIMRIWTAI